MTRRHDQSRARITPVRAALAGLALGAVVVGGCAGGAASPTDGYEVTLRRQNASARQFMMYQVDDEGRVVYTGGRRAMLNEDAFSKPTWTGTLTRDQASGLVALLRQNPAPATTDPREGEPEYRVSIRGPGSFLGGLHTSGPTPFFDALYGELRRVVLSQRGAGLSEELVPAP